MEAERAVDLELFLAEELIAGRLVREAVVTPCVVANVVVLVAC